MSKSRFRFTEDFDLHLAREVYGHNPYEDPKRWTLIQVNMIQITGRSITIRTLRDRIHNLVKKYCIRSDSMKGKSGIEIPVSEIDDLLHQIMLMKSRISNASSIDNKMTYQVGLEAREKACEKLLGGVENVSDISQRSVLNSTLLEDIEGTNHEEDVIVNNYVEINHNFEPEVIRENEQENIPSPTEKEPIETTVRKRPLAQTNIMAPKRMRNTTNIKQTTVNYLEKKNQNQYELRCREMKLEERKQLLEESKFEMDRIERTKRLEIEERRLAMEERRMQIQLELFANQQELIKILLKK